MFKLNLVTPDKKLVADQELEEIVLPAFKGELAILPGHAPLMTTLEPGILSYKLKGQSEVKVAISWGYCQVSPEAVNVLAESAMMASEIDLKVVQQHLKTQEERIASESLSDADWADAQHEVARLKAEVLLAGGPTSH
jgi:F-type H+-transporting ATPase subunit epsilon